MNELFTEDEIVVVDEHLKNLKGKILQEENATFFTLKEYNIKGVSKYPFNWFKKRKEVRMFYIESLTLEFADGSYTHTEDDMCSLNGMNMMMECQLRFSKLEKELIKFTISTGITLKYGKLELLN